MTKRFGSDASRGVVELSSAGVQLSGHDSLVTGNINQNPTPRLISGSSRNTTLGNTRGICVRFFFRKTSFFSYTVYFLSKHNLYALFI